MVRRTVAAAARRGDGEGNAAQFGDLPVGGLRRLVRRQSSSDFRMSRSSSMRARVINGTRTDRLGCISKALGDQAAERLADRRPADAERAGDEAEGELLARYEASHRQCLTQRIVDLRAQRGVGHGQSIAHGCRGL